MSHHAHCCCSPCWQAANTIEELTAEEMPQSMRRALHVLSVLQRSAASGAELSRVSALLASLLAEPRVQQQLIELSLQLAERGIKRGIKAIFGVRSEG